MANTIVKHGRRFVRQARLPRCAYQQKALGDVLYPYMKKSDNFAELIVIGKKKEENYE